jgi:hypothetical protein
MPNGWHDKDCAKWLVRGLRIAPNGCEWPQHKKATIKWQFGDRVGQLKNCGEAIIRSRRPKEKMRHGNQRIALAERKKRSAAIGVSRRPLQKIAVRQLGYRASIFKIHGTAIEVSRRPLQKLRRGNRSIVPANKNCGAAIVVSRRPNKKHGAAIVV